MNTEEKMLLGAVKAQIDSLSQGMKDVSGQVSRMADKLENIGLDMTRHSERLANDKEHFERLDTSCEMLSRVVDRLEKSQQSQNDSISELKRLSDSREKIVGQWENDHLDTHNTEKREQRKERHWLVGTIIGILALLIPIAVVIYYKGL